MTQPLQSRFAGTAIIRLIIVLVLAAIWPAWAAAQWDRPIDWMIPCTALVAGTWGSNSVLCDDVHNAGGLKDTLDGASRILEGLGFGSPAIGANLDLAHHTEMLPAAGRALQRGNHHDPRCEDRYCAWLVYGLRNHGQYSPADKSLLLDPFRIINGRLEPGYDDGFGFAEVHELFHAVQFGYPSVSSDDGYRWLIEGSAEHVARAIGRSMGLSLDRSVWLRTYDHALHTPPVSDSEDSDFKDWAYGSWEFFDFLGEYLGSDVGIQYLIRLLDTLDSDESNGLLAVQVAIQSESDKSLYEVFPEFVARRLVYPCYFKQLGAWEDGDCKMGRDNEHRFALSFPDTVQRLNHIAADMSANGYLVRMEVPEGKQGKLTIQVPPDQDADHLHLIIDGQRRDLLSIGQRNSYTTVLPAGAHEFFVRLANVPRELAEVAIADYLDFGEEDPAPIEFTLVEFDATVIYSGGLRGSFEAKDNDRFGVLYGTPPHPAYCRADLTLTSTEGDYLNISGFIPAPLAPGIFPIGPDAGLTLPGIMAADIGVPCAKRGCYESGLAEGQRRRFADFTGELEITRVTEYYVAGRLNMTGFSGSLTAGVDGFFSVQIGSGGGFSNNHPCDPSHTPVSTRGPANSAPDPEIQNPPGAIPESTPVQAPPSSSDGESSLVPTNGHGTNLDDSPALEPIVAADAVDQPKLPADEFRKETLFLQFSDHQQSALKSTRQVAQGEISATSVSLSSTAFDLTLAVPIFGCSVPPSEHSAFQRLQQASRTAGSHFLLDLKAGSLQLESAADEVLLDVSSANRRVTLHRRPESAISFDTSNPAATVGIVTNVTLEITVDQETLRCIEPLGLTFSVFVDR